MFECEVCQKHPIRDSIATFRVNEYGIPGIFRCREHLETPIDSDVDEIVRIIEEDNERVR